MYEIDDTVLYAILACMCYGILIDRNFEFKPDNAQRYSKTQDYSYGPTQFRNYDHLKIITRTFKFIPYHF